MSLQNMKMIYFDNITNENKQNITQMARRFQIIHTEYLYLAALDQKKSMDY